MRHMISTAKGLACWRLAAVGVVFVFSIVSAANGLPQQSKPDGATGSLIARLWSADPGEARAAKDRIVEIGPTASPGLMSVLDQITRAPEAPHYPFTASPDPSGITDRVTYDICELLGDFRAVEAIPLLIRVMERKRMYGLFEHITVEIFALAKIGPPAVPALIHEIRDIRFKLTLQYALGGKGRIAIESRMSRIQENAAIALEQIGDPAALPALEELLYTTDNGMLARTVNGTIDSIRAKYSARQH
jgi:hypothetical protein